MGNNSINKSELTERKAGCKTWLHYGDGGSAQKPETDKRKVAGKQCPKIFKGDPIAVNWEDIR